jgi:small subunit ribosomal protein S17
MAETEVRGRRKVRQGVVTSDKMTKTVVVSLVRRYAHPEYGKQVTRTKTVKAHDDKSAKIGDTVRIMETRPIAKTVRWRYIRVVVSSRAYATRRTLPALRKRWAIRTSSSTAPRTAAWPPISSYAALRTIRYCPFAIAAFDPGALTRGVRK